jgi:hypothetical protein
MKGIKSIGVVVVLMTVAMLVGCGDRFTEGVTSQEQLVADVIDMEAYLADNGYVNYDTLDGEIRVVVLEEGDGSTIEFEDIVLYDFTGRFLDEIIFDTTIPELAFEQDTAYADTIAFELDDNDELVLDVNGFPTIEYVEFEDDYFSTYISSSEYSRQVTTHTPDGWFILNEGGFALGFEQGVHYTLSNVKIGGKVLVILPAQVGSDLIGIGGTVFSSVFGAQPLIFEISPVRIK